MKLLKNEIAPGIGRGDWHERVQSVGLKRRVEMIRTGIKYRIYRAITGRLGGKWVKVV